MSAFIESVVEQPALAWFEALGAVRPAFIAAKVRPGIRAEGGHMTNTDRIVRDPAICGGQATVRGTRVLVRTILGYLAHGEPADVILRELPSLTEDDVRAVIAFAATAASEDPPAAAHDETGMADLVGLLEPGDLERHPQGEDEKRDPLA
jgi:uncharacterized protein (DUF433 family)